jgi:hypothetical protein
VSNTEEVVSAKKMNDPTTVCNFQQLLRSPLLTGGL